MCPNSKAIRPMKPLQETPPGSGFQKGVFFYSSTEGRIGEASDLPALHRYSTGPACSLKLNGTKAGRPSLSDLNINLFRGKEGRPHQ